MTKKKKSNWLLITLFVIFFSAVLGLTIWGVINKDKVKQLLNKNSTLYTKSEVEEIARENYNKGLGDRSTYEKLINELKVELVNEKSDKQKLANEKQELLAQHERDLEMIAQKETEINNRIQRISELEAKIAKYEKLISDTELEGYVTVLFVVNDEVYESQVIEQNSTAKFPTIDPAIEGYEFDGWTLDHNTIIDDISSVSVLSDTTYYAKLTQICNVNLYTGTNYATQISIRKDLISDSYTFADYYSDNYTFINNVTINNYECDRDYELIGWSKTADLIVSDITEITNDVNLYAVFRSEITIKILAMEDTLSPTAIYGDQYSAPKGEMFASPAYGYMRYFNGTDSYSLNGFVSINKLKLHYRQFDGALANAGGEGFYKSVTITAEETKEIAPIEMWKLGENSLEYSFNHTNENAKLTITKTKITLTQNVKHGEIEYYNYIRNNQKVNYLNVDVCGYKIFNDTTITLCVPKGE